MLGKGKVLSVTLVIDSRPRLTKLPGSEDHAVSVLQTQEPTSFS